MLDRRWPTYPSREVTLAEAVPDDTGRGAVRVRDSEGREYLDAIVGIGCLPLGHGHPRWADAIAGQLRSLVASASTFWTDPQQRLAAEVVRRSPIEDGRVFLSNTGAEATEAALKLSLRATGRDIVIAFDRAFHGRTLGAIALTANPKYRHPYIANFGEPHEGRFAHANVVRLPYGDLDVVGRAFAEHRDRVAAVLLEPIQGEGGIHPAKREFLVGLHELCRRNGAVLGLDEIQSGVGRTGNFAAWTTIVGDDPALYPDVIWYAKALGGGYPVAACVARRELAETMTLGSHGSTYGGNPVACTAALATLSIMDDEKLFASAANQLPTLQRIAAADPEPRVKQVRGLGAMIGIEIEGPPDRSAPHPATTLAGPLMREGLLATICGGTTVRLLMPFRCGEVELAEAWRAVRAALGHG